MQKVFFYHFSHNFYTQQLTEEERDIIFDKLKIHSDNKSCIDCSKKNPQWASVYFGIFICMDCASNHRKYGQHISFVRSLTLDSWNRRQILFMELGGNAKANNYFKKNNLRLDSNKLVDYQLQGAQRYKNDLVKKVDSNLSLESLDLQSSANQSTQNSSNPIHQEEINHILENDQIQSIKTNTLQIPNSVGEQGATQKLIINQKIIWPNKLNKVSTIKARKILDIDFNNLCIDDTPEERIDQNKYMKAKSTELTINQTFNPIQNINVKQLSTAKSLSSQKFNQNNNSENHNYSEDYKKFKHSQSISSSQMFNEPNPIHHNNNLDSKLEIVRDIFQKTGEKIQSLKVNASYFINRWQNKIENN